MYLLLLVKLFRLNKAGTVIPQPARRWVGLINARVLTSRSYKTGGLGDRLFT